MLSAIWTIARNTFLESIRQSTFLVVLAACVALLVINPAISQYTLDNDDKLLVDMGLSTIFLGGLFLAAFTASSVLGREIENKTALTVISKPIGRPAFVLGKYLGVMGAVLLAYWICAIVFLMTFRHGVMTTAADTVDWPVMIFGSLAVLVALSLALWGNYFYGWVFTSRFSGILAITMGLAYLLVLLVNKEWGFQPITAEFTFWDQGLAKNERLRLDLLLAAMFLELEALAVVAAVAITCSTRLGQVMTLSICLALAALGLMSDYLLGTHAATDVAAMLGEGGSGVAGAVAVVTAKAAYAATYNMQFIWLADAITQQHPVTIFYIVIVTAYSACYTVGTLALAVISFQKREMG